MELVFELLGGRISCPEEEDLKAPEPMDLLFLRSKLKTFLNYQIKRASMLFRKITMMVSLDHHLVVVGRKLHMFIFVKTMNSVIKLRCLMLTNMLWCYHSAKLILVS